MGERSTPDPNRAPLPFAAHRVARAAAGGDDTLAILPAVRHASYLRLHLLVLLGERDRLRPGSVGYEDNRVAYLTAVERYLEALHALPPTRHWSSLLIDVLSQPAPASLTSTALAMTLEDAAAGESEVRRRLVRIDVAVHRAAEAPRQRSPRSSRSTTARPGRPVPLPPREETP